VAHWQVHGGGGELGERDAGPNIYPFGVVQVQVDGAVGEVVGEEFGTANVEFIPEVLDAFVLIKGGVFYFGHDSGYGLVVGGVEQGATGIGSFLVLAQQEVGNDDVVPEQQDGLAILLAEQLLLQVLQ